MTTLSPAVARDRLAVGDARDLGRRLHPVLALQLFEDDVQVNVTKPRDDQLLRLLDTFHVQRRVLFAQPRQAAGDLLLVASGLGRDRQGVCRPGQVQRRERPTVLHAQRVPGERVGELGRRADVAGAYLCGGNVLLAARKENLSEPFLATAGQVGQVCVGLDRAGHDLEIADAAELVAARAEHEGLGGFVGLRVRRRHQLSDRGHQSSDAQELGRGAAHHRRHLSGEDSLAQAALDLLLAQRAGVEVLLEQRVVALGGGLDQLAPVLLDELLHVVRYGNLAALAVWRRHERFEVQEVDDAAEVLLRTDRQVQRERDGATDAPASLRPRRRSRSSLCPAC